MTLALPLAILNGCRSLLEKTACLFLRNQCAFSAMAAQAISTGEGVPLQVTFELTCNSYSSALFLQCSHLIPATTGSCELGPSYGKFPDAHGVARLVIWICIWVEL